jgi:chromate transporter
VELTHGRAEERPERGHLIEVLIAATTLGLTSFGGPVAHLGYFRQEYVVRRRWLDEQRYADLVALCQFLPGQASSQVGIAVGMLRAGLAGGVVAWLGFTLPSALALVAFAYAVQETDLSGAGWLHGLKLAAVAVVANAVWGMGRSLTPDRERMTIAVLSAILLLLWQTALSQVLAIGIGGLVGWRLLASGAQTPAPTARASFSNVPAIAALTLFFGLLVALPLLREVSSSQALAVFDSFYRTVRWSSAAATSCCR